MSEAAHINAADTTSQINGALPAMRTTAMIISLGAFGISVIYTILFNVGQASGSATLNLFGYDFPYEQALLGATGVIQDSSEILAFLFGFWLLTQKGKKPFFIVAIAVTSIIISITLVLWSIASTWGGNNAMIDSSTAASRFEQTKFAAIQQSIQTNQAAVQDLSANAAAIREQAARYGGKFISRSIEKIHEANEISGQAAQLSQQSLSAVDKLASIDSELISHVNSAEAAFARISAATGLDKEVVSTTFLLTRATQLEIIGIISGLFVILVPAARRKTSASSTTNTTNETPKTQTPASPPVENGAAPVLALAPNSTGKTNGAGQGSSHTPAEPTIRESRTVPAEAPQPKPDTLARIKAAAERGAEKAIEKGAETAVKFQQEGQQRNQQTAELVHAIADKFQQRPAAKDFDPRWLKAAQIDEFATVFTAITTGQVKPAQNQIAAKRKLCGSHKARDIMHLMWVMHWLDKQAEKGTYSLPEQNTRLKIKMPLSKETAQRHAKLLTALATAKQEKGE